MKRPERGIEPVPAQGSGAPWPAETPVREALADYLAENGFTIAGYTEPRAEVSLLGIRFTIPNPPGRQRAIAMHDLHHVATGCGTDIAGEAEVSAFELRRGLAATSGYVRFLIVIVVLGGFVLAPRRTYRAYVIGDARKGNLFAGTDQYEALLGMSVGELRARVGLPPPGLTLARRGFHSAVEQFRAMHSAPTAGQQS